MELSIIPSSMSEVHSYHLNYIPVYGAGPKIMKTAHFQAPLSTNIIEVCGLQADTLYKFDIAAVNRLGMKGPKSTTHVHVPQ